METAMTPRHDKLWFLDTLVNIRVSEHDGSNGMSLIEHRAPFAHSPPLHVHRNEDEIFHVLTGELRVRVGDRDVCLRAGETLLAPRGVPHTFAVESQGGATLLTMTSGGDFERLVRSQGRPAARDGLPVSVAPTPEQIQALEAACLANGITLVGPPLTPALEAA
jgi:mannose-6-phosphate isomerase-like protein (cupin superfamily)